MGSERGKINDWSGRAPQPHRKAIGQIFFYFHLHVPRVFLFVPKETSKVYLPFRLLFPVQSLRNSPESCCPRKGRVSFADAATTEKLVSSNLKGKKDAAGNGPPPSVRAGEINLKALNFPGLLVLGNEPLLLVKLNRGEVNTNV